MVLSKLAEPTQAPANLYVAAAEDRFVALLQCLEAGVGARGIERPAEAVRC